MLATLISEAATARHQRKHPDDMVQIAKATNALVINTVPVRNRLTFAEPRRKIAHTEDGIVGVFVAHQVM